MKILNSTVKTLATTLALICIIGLSATSISAQTAEPAPDDFDIENFLDDLYSGSDQTAPAGQSCSDILDDCFGAGNQCGNNIECQAQCLRDNGCSAHVDNGPPRTLVIPRVQPNSNCPTRKWKKCWFGLAWCEQSDSGNPQGPRYPVCHDEGTPTTSDGLAEQYFYGPSDGTFPGAKVVQDEIGDAVLNLR